MRRRRKNKPSDDAVSLFPFLAVLICTMGSLIVLLVVLVQQAHLHANEEASEDQAKRQAEIEELKDAKQLQDLRLEVLAPERDEVLGQLDNKNLQLGHLEDHIDRLEQRWKQLVEQARQLKTLAKQDESDRQLADEQMDLIQEQIEANRAAVKGLEKQLANQKRAYAIVPYHGGNGTSRRPIFLECMGDKIVIRPENIELKVSDFQGPIGTGPGNPLDAALRTIREQYAAAGAGEPYPLLVVRPSGTHAYGAARAAMTSWDDAFGYELIGADKKLKYPPADELLAARVREAIKRARNRQAMLAAAMPGGFNGGAARYVAKRRGGLERISGPAPSKTRPKLPGMEAVDQGREDANPLEANGAEKKPDPQQTAQGEGGAPMAAISNHRGSNWGVPNANEHTQGFTRPVRVVCLPDRLMILPPKGQVFSPIVTPFDGALGKEDVLKFVTKLWQHMESWGIAAQGGYWVPVLSVEVQPGAEPQFQRFVQLLAKSGIQVRRRTQ